MSVRLRGCVLLGGTSGIGRQISRRLVERGVRTISTYFESKDHALEIGATDRSLISWIRADIRDRASLEAVLRLAIKELPAIDLVVNTVGGSRSLSLENITFADWRDCIDVNLFGALVAAQIFGLYMKQHEGGAIVNVSSVAAIRPVPKGHDYVSAKAGLMGLTQSLALELAPQVVVNAVAPGWITTERRARTPQDHGEILSQIPLQRFGVANDIAETVLFLANPHGYITGQTIIVDGGYTL